MHDEIKKFNLTGQVGDPPNMVKVRENMIFVVESMMRDYGYVPSIDNDPQFTLDMNQDTGEFEFELSVYGVPVGKDKAWSVSGVTTGKAIPKSIPRSRLSPSLPSAT